MLVAVTVLVASTWIFVEIAQRVRSGDTVGFDEWAVQSLRRPDNPRLPRGPQWTVEMGRDFTALGGVAVLSLMTFAAAVYLLLQRKSHAVALMLLAIVSGVVLSTLLKYYFARPRPGVGSDLTQVITSSFPSGHSMLSAIVYLVLGAMLARLESRWLLKIYFVVIAMLLTFIVGASRVYLGVHYPTDVLAGWTAGLAWALVWWLIARYLQTRGAIETSYGPATRSS